MHLKIIDCTIRDGGHLNNWNFSTECVAESYNAALKSGADYFEIGYRFDKNTRNLGQFAYCNDEYLASILKPSKKCKLLVMLDAEKVQDSNLFTECTPKYTHITGVRVAAYAENIQSALKILEKLKANGYEVFLNLMAFSDYTQEHFKVLKNWKNKDIIEAVIFADSFGSFMPYDIPDYIKILKDIGFNNIGFHSHNNLQLSFANTLKAIEEGVDYIDCSIYGMGRGAGNLPVETLIGHLANKYNSKYNIVPYLEIIEKYYIKLAQDYNWGYSVPSLMSGLKNIHPYYVEDLYTKHEYKVGQAWDKLDSIREKCPVSFSSEKLNSVL